MKHPILKILTLSLTLLAATSAWSDEVDTIIAKEHAPAGVVFEIISGKAGSLATLLPVVKDGITRLRDRFADLPVAVVTHGYEQFDLLKANRSKESKAHSMVEELVKKDDVDVHVCGTHAERRGRSPEDFPAYVDVTAAGPAQINDYRELGYEVIVLR